MSKAELKIGIIGYNFMGKAHSNAWLQANRFFDAPFTAVLKAACGRNEAATREFADNWGWQHVETDWRKVVTRDDIDLIDIAARPTEPVHKKRNVLLLPPGSGFVVFPFGAGGQWRCGSD